MTENKRILYLTTDGLTDPLGRSQILPYLERLSVWHTITIISLEKPHRLAEVDALHKRLSQLSLSWIALKYHKKPAVFATLWDLHQMKKAAKTLCKNNAFDIVHTRSYLAGLIGLFLKKKFNIRMLFDSRGFWIDERIEGKIWNMKNPMYGFIVRYLRKKELALYGRADALVLLTEKAKSYILNHHRLKPKTTLIEVIPCCADETLFNPKALNKEKIEALKAEHAIKPEDFILSYHGSLGTWYKTNEVVDFFCALRTKINNAKFLLVTHDDSYPFKSYWQKQGLPSELLICLQANREEVPYYLSLSHLAIFFIHPTFSKIASSPTKLAEIILMNIPFVTNSHIGDINELIKQSVKGRLINELNTPNYLKSLEEILLLKTHAVDEIQLQAYFSLQRGVTIYHHIYTQLIEENNVVTFT